MLLRCLTIADGPHGMHNGSRSSLWHPQPFILSFLQVPSHRSPPWPCPLWLHTWSVCSPPIFPLRSHFDFLFTMWFPPQNSLQDPSSWVTPANSSIRFCRPSCWGPPSLLFPERRLNARALHLVLTDVCSCLCDTAYRTRFVFSTTS